MKRDLRNIPSRRGRKQLTVWIRVENYIKLSELAGEETLYRAVDDLIEEAKLLDTKQIPT